MTDNPKVQDELPNPQCSCENSPLESPGLSNDHGTIGHTLPEQGSSLQPNEVSAEVEITGFEHKAMLTRSVITVSIHPLGPVW